MIAFMRFIISVNDQLCTIGFSTGNIFGNVFHNEILQIQGVVSAPTDALKLNIEKWDMKKKVGVIDNICQRRILSKQMLPIATGETSHDITSFTII